MNWNTRYSADKMGPDTFYAGEGLLKVGPKTYPLDPDFNAKFKNIKDQVPDVRGGIVKFPNGHTVQATWWTPGPSSPFEPPSRFTEHPTHVDVIHKPPLGKDITDLPVHSSLSRVHSSLWGLVEYGENLDHHQVNDLMEHVKGL